MPPAFNLSQDQTLQFDLIAKFNSLDSAIHPLDESEQRTVDQDAFACTPANRTSVV
jgi:hypothetical protein